MFQVVELDPRVHDRRGALVYSLEKVHPLC